MAGGPPGGARVTLQLGIGHPLANLPLSPQSQGHSGAPARPKRAAYSCAPRENGEPRRQLACQAVHRGAEVRPCCLRASRPPPRHTALPPPPQLPAPPRRSAAAPPAPCLTVCSTRFARSSPALSAMRFRRAPPPCRVATRPAGAPRRAAPRLHSCSWHLLKPCAPLPPSPPHRQCLNSALAVAAAADAQRCPSCRAQLPLGMPPLAINTALKSLAELLLPGGCHKKFGARQACSLAPALCRYNRPPHVIPRPQPPPNRHPHPLQTTARSAARPRRPRRAARPCLCSACASAPRGAPCPSTARGT